MKVPTDQLRLVKKSEARITISPSVDSGFVVVELTHGALTVSLAVEKLELLDLREPEKKA